METLNGWRNPVTYGVVVLVVVGVIGYVVGSAWKRKKDPPKHEHAWGPIVGEGCSPIEDVRYCQCGARMVVGSNDFVSDAWDCTMCGGRHPKGKSHSESVRIQEPSN